MWSYWTPKRWPLVHALVWDHDSTPARPSRGPVRLVDPRRVVAYEAIGEQGDSGCRLFLDGGHTLDLFERLSDLPWLAQRR